jgi:hypothetical protein
MAIWEPHDTLRYVNGNRNVATDGTYIYYWVNCPSTNTAGFVATGGIYRYEPGTTTETLIISNANIATYLETLYPVILLGANEYNSVAMICFNEEIYVAVHVIQYNNTSLMDEVCLDPLPPEEPFATTQHTLSVCSVGVSSITQVTSLTPDNIAGYGSSFFGYTGLWADSDNIVAMITLDGTGLTCPDPPEVLQFCKYSGNGSSWSTVAVGGDGYIISEHAFSFQEGRDFRGLGIFEYANSKIYQFTGGTWVLVDGSVDGGHSLYETGPTYHLTKTDGTGYAPANLSAYNTLTPPAFFSPARQLNMQWSMGYGFDSADEAYKLEGGAWVVLDQIDPSLLFDYTGGTDLDNWFIRLDSGVTYMIKVNGGAGSEVWKRDTNFDPTPDSWSGGSSPPCTNFAIFYYGIETPLVRGELPFCGVNPGALAVSAGGVALVGGNIVLDGEGLISSVVYAESPYDDNDFIDMSGIVPLTTGVSSVKIV